MTTPNSSFKTRLQSALVLAPVVLLVVYFGGGGFTIMMAAAAAIGVHEWARMVLTGKKAPAFLPELAGAGALVAALTMLFFDNPVTALWILLAFGFLYFSYNFSQKGPSPWLALFGLVYIGFSIDIMIWLRAGTGVQGLYHFATLLLVVWASDIAAYFTGKAIGGPKLAPRISPKKTWAGFIGSSIGAGAVAAGLASPQVTQWLDVDTLGGLSYAGYFIMGAVLAAVGQAGDLFISIFKRHFGIKDTGTLIPGHGGILDRIDALLLVAIVFGALAVVMP